MFGSPGYRVRPPALIPILVLAAVSAALPLGAAAQTLSGKLVESGSQQPVAGAQVSLHRADKTRVAFSFSDTAGMFTLRGFQSGEYELQVVRLGFSSIRIPLQLDSARDLIRRFDMPAKPIELGSVVGDGARSCTKSRMTRDAALLWEDIRKAFETVASAAELPKISYVAIEYTRNVDRWKKVQATDSTTVALVGERGPYLSLPADSLLQSGFIQPDPTTGAFAYFGPDAEVLMSPPFLASYCFEQAPVGERAGKTGLRFRASNPDTVPGIRGTIWADSRTHELSSVDFKYDRLPVNDPTIDAGGVIEFSRLPNGPWIVTRWLLNAPRFVEQRSLNGAGTELFFTTYRQLERIVEEARYADGRIAFRRSIGKD